MNDMGGLDDATGDAPQEVDQAGIRRVGSGITEYNREPSLFDSEYLDRVRRSEPVPAEISRSGQPAFKSTCERLFAFCRGVYEAIGLPDPFCSSHLEDALPPVSLEEALSGGSTRFEELKRRCYQPNCLRYSPNEDHSVLWYASQIALQLLRLEWYALKAKEGTFSDGRSEVHADQTGRYFALVGWELGRLDTEYRLKCEHETDALSGKSVKRGRESSLASRQRKGAERNAAAFAIMEAAIGSGASIRHAATLAVAEMRPGLRPREFDREADRLVKAFMRAKRAKP
jgi:hypothetical protein